MKGAPKSYLGVPFFCSSSGHRSMGRIAVFIDGAYLEHLLKEEFGAPRIDFALLVKHASRHRELLRAYYYDCLPFQSEPPSGAGRRLRRDNVTKPMARRPTANSETDGGSGIDSARAPI